MISEKKILTVLLAGTSAALPLVAQKKAAEIVQQPNLLVIMVDQYRPQAMGFLGKEPVLTPNIDALAKDGVVFNHAVSNYPLSSPARGIFLSGKYPFGNGVIGNCQTVNAPYGVELKEDEVCWSDVLKKENYSLGYIGKLHLDAPHEPYIPTYNNEGSVAWNEWTPPSRRHGFDYWMAYGTYDRHLKPMYWDTKGGRNDFFYVDQYGPEFEADKAIEFMKNAKGDLRHQDKPFALMVSMNPPHPDYDQVPQRYVDMYKEQDVDKLASIFPNIPPKGSKYGDYYRRYIHQYYGAITATDEHIGRMVDYLKQSQQYDNTLIVFVSDHGNCLGIHDKDGKNTYYDESLRIPLIMTYPKALKPRVDDDTQIGIGDLYPTMLTLLGFKKSIPTDVQTIDHGGDLLKNRSSNKAKYQTYYFINVPTANKNGVRGIRSKRYTYAITVKNSKIVEQQLFDRQTDPFEMKDIVTEQPALAKKFLADLRQQLKREQDQLVIE